MTKLLTMTLGQYLEQLDCVVLRVHGRAVVRGFDAAVQLRIPMGWRGLDYNLAHVDRLRGSLTMPIKSPLEAGIWRSHVAGRVSGVRAHYLEAAVNPLLWNRLVDRLEARA